jgi:hypothetical protein
MSLYLALYLLTRHANNEELKLIELLFDCICFEFCIPCFIDECSSYGLYTCKAPNQQTEIYVCFFEPFSTSFTASSGVYEGYILEQSQSHITTDGQLVRMSWCQAQSGTFD